MPRTLLTLAVPKSCFRLEREQLLTTSLPFARFFLHCSESNVTRNDERRVILSAWRERIRNPLKRKNGLPHTFGARNDGGDWKWIVTRLTELAMTGEIGNGLPHTFGARNDGGDWKWIVTRLTVLERQNGVSF